MMKIGSLLLALFLTVMSIADCRADFEAVETILARVENVQKEAQNVQEQIKQVQAAINEVRQGGWGILKDMGMGVVNVAGAMAKGMAQNAIASIQPKGVAENTDDTEKLKANIEKTMVPQYGTKNQDETYSETKKVTDALKRENISRFYALAFTTRTNMAKEAREKGEDDKPKELTESRAMVQAANDEALESAERLNRILDMQASIDEFTMTDLLQSFSAEAEEGSEKKDDGEAKK